MHKYKHRPCCVNDRYGWITLTAIMVLKTCVKFRRTT